MRQRSFLISIGSSLSVLALSLVVFVVQPAAAQPRSSPNSPSATNWILQPVVDWFERAHREYQDAVVKQLSVPTGKVGNQIAGQSQPTVIEQVRGWLGIATPKMNDSPEVASQPAKPAGNSGLEAQIARQNEARAIEAQRAAEASRLALAAKQAQDGVDMATMQRQKAADAARMAGADKPQVGDTTDQSRVAAAPTQGAKPPREAAPASAEPPKAQVEVKPSPPAAQAAVVAAVPENNATNPAVEFQEQPTPRANAQAAPDSQTRWNRLPRSGSETDRTKTARGEVTKPARETSPPHAETSAANTATGERWNRLPRSDEARRGSAVEAAGRLAAAASRAGDRLLEGAKPRLAKLASGASSREKGRRSCKRAGVPVEPPATYTVKHGDSLWTIARRHYDRGRRYVKIVRANEDKIASPNLIYPCQKFFLPGRHAQAWAIADGGPS